MVDQPKADTVMKFITKNSSAVKAECALDKDPDDTYMKDFTPQTYTSYSDFFEITKFSFELDVKDMDKSKKTPSDQKGGNRPATPRGKASNVAGDFASWRSAETSDAPNVLFPLEFDHFSFERLIDAASPVFFEYCVKSLSFDAAYLVKRVSRGLDQVAAGFLRLEFKNVLITKLSWDDGDLTTEKCDFICRDFKVQYRQLLADGTFGLVSSAQWNYKVNALPTR